MTVAEVHQCGHGGTVVEAVVWVSSAACRCCCCSWCSVCCACCSGRDAATWSREGGGAAVAAGCRSLNVGISVLAVTRAVRQPRPRDVADLDCAVASSALRIDRRTLQRVLAKRSVRSDTADRISIALGRHPGELRPERFS